MSDVSVLLNLTSRIAFEETDPLMSLINAKEPLLFYDRLSVEKFPSDKELYLEQTERLASNLRNLLEARSLSLTDDDGRIRLIIVLDLVEGLFQPKDSSLFFPAQNVRAIIQLIADVFGKRNPLLERMEYVFLFINSGADDKRLSLFYQQLAYDGFTGGDAQTWFNSDSIRLNERRDELLKGLNSPDVDLPINNASVSAVYRQFLGYYNDVQDSIASKLDEAGVGGDFRALLKEAVSLVKTVGDFETFDYNGVFRASVSKLIGLKAKDFSSKCVFFILKYEESPASVKQRHDVFVKSLVQLLCTISERDYDRYFKPGAKTSARLFLLSEYSSSIDVESLAALNNQVKLCLPRLTDARWTEDMDVEYNVYSPNVSDPIESDTHRKLNELYAKQRRELNDEFMRVRRVPFFFGKKKGEWDWYFRVLESVNNLYEFEKENDRPLYDTPKRLTKKQMTCNSKKSTYQELIDAKAKLSEKDVPVMHVEDLNGYMMKRRELMSDFSKAINELKVEMPKLGYFVCLFWMGVLSVLCFTLCYAYHFFWFDNADPLYYIAIAFGAAGLFFLVASLIGQSSVKKRIRAVYQKIDRIYNQMQTNLEKYLQDVNKRAKLQKQADIRRCNLDEMNQKLDEYQSHNKRINLWKTHFSSIANKLDYMLQTLGKVEDIPEESIRLHVEDFSLDGFPAMPLVIRSRYHSMDTQIMQVPLDIHSVTCFVKHFRFTEISSI